MVPFLKIFAFVLSKLTDRPKESEAFWRLLIWFCRPAGVGETNTWSLRTTVGKFPQVLGAVECYVYHFVGQSQQPQI